ncbi:hypothetical protein HELRODRAFT_104700 [Helobdella robusta]|uniref:Arginyl-tRNA--protein transferase 1 n=1 Tax=Helobdella robusta TaxID=6412 RepID=T1EDN2_HELRO|nr:hypothetical protein HELRODRAFT_104700 [Helobdella robusta]ESO11314.1 hypothetical protein HELRODRAFT_104700 [Helobdella robusta]
MSDRSVSIVEYFGADESGHSCGYCKSPDTNFSYGIWGHQVTCQDYQDLIDRGWRRSGKYIYKPRLEVQCCKMYTIKCDAVNFKMNKSHKKIIKNFNKFINYGILPKEKKDAVDDENVHHSPPPPHHHQVQGHQMKRGDGNDDASFQGLQSDQVDKIDNEVTTATTTTTTTTSASNDDGGGDERVASDDKMELDNNADGGGGGGNSKPDGGDEADAKDGFRKQQKMTAHPKPGVGADKTKGPCKKAKLMRVERKQMKVMKLETSVVFNDRQQHHQQQQQDQQQQQQQQQKSAKMKNHPKSLEDFLGEIIEKPSHKFEIKMVAAHDDTATAADFPACHAVYHKYQTCIHNDPPSKPTTKQFTRFLINTPLLPSTATTTTPTTSVPATTTNSYKTTSASTSSEVPQGSFHQQYWLDGELVAVGVVDVLTKCLSSVYFFYDPKYSALSLGTYAALREIAFTRHLHTLTSNNNNDNIISSYYMGFYIHSCPKMRYKGQYSPSYLLCPEKYSWQPIEKCLPLIQVNPYSRLDDSSETGGEMNEEEDISDVGILYRNTLMSYLDYRTVRLRAGGRPEEEERLKLYVKLIGRELGQRMFLFRD